jgi:anti-sigma factor RsiW
MPKLNCKEAQDLLDAFHDNELDNVNSLAVQEHLENCPDCRRHWWWLCEVEASFKRLSESVPSPSEDFRLRTLRRDGVGLLRHDDKRSGPLVTWFRARRRLAGVVSLAMLCVIAAVILFSARSGADVMLFVRDSVKVAESVAPVDFNTSSTPEAGAWLKQHIGLGPIVSSPTGFKLLGARSCRINNELVGLLLFQRDHQQIACYVSRFPMTTLRGYDSTTADGIRLGTCEGRHVAAWDSGDVYYLLVSDLTQDALVSAANEVSAGAFGSLKD